MPDIFATPNADAVKVTAELLRVRDLPRRVGELHDLTELLKKPAGEMSLRAIQSAALFDLGNTGGLFGPLRVGAGKTLISLLAPVVTFCQRPLLLVPAKLVDKTARDREELARHFYLPEFIRVISYEWLGRVQAADALDEYAPDLIIADECHKLKNKRAAVTRRVVRYMRAKPDTKFVAMSGTITKRSLHDFAHIMRWCFGKWDAPLPLPTNELELWADALDERKGQTKRADPGALQVLCNTDEVEAWRLEPRRTARRAYRRRLTETPGVVATSETPIDASLEVQAVEPPESASIEDAFKTLRSKWETPDGWPIADGLAMFRHARELALGFFYKWDPRPPKEWLEPRKAWCAHVRSVLRYSRKLDSELQVRNQVQREIDAGKETDGAELLTAWVDVRDSFEPNTVPVWLTDSIVEWCESWIDRHMGIVWTEHTCFAERLAELSGQPYYGRKGRSAGGQAIEDADPNASMIASVASNGEGRNLQAWHSNLIVSPPPNGQQWEQLLGRTHRDGQRADTVTVDMIATCAEHVGAFMQAVRDCEFVYDLNGSPQKLLQAAIIMPTATDIALRSGARWDKPI